MIKKSIMSRGKSALLAIASVALLTPVVRGATVTPQLGDLILGFRADANPGQTLNLEVDLGPITQFYVAPGQTVALPQLAVADLSATYGANWATRTDLYWGAVATAGRAAAYSNNVVNVPVGTLWATAPNCGFAFNRGSVFAQKNASATIEAAFTAGAAGSLYGATATANSLSAAIITSTLAGSWSAQDLKTSGTSFGYFNPTVDNFEGTNVVVSQLYELQPGSGPGTYLGDLILTPSGLSFRGASPTAAVCKGTVVVQANGSCEGSVTVEDIDNGSTGFCSSLALDQTGPFPIGTTNVTLTVTDGNGGSNSCSATVVVEGAAPSISSVANITQCSPVVTFSTPTATGCNTPIGAVVCVPASGSTFSSGATTVRCTATDSFSKIGSNSFTVTITGANPTVSCPSSIVTNVASASDTSIVVTYSTPSGSGCATPINVVCLPASGSTFNVGATTVTCTATDALNHTGTCSFTVTVNGAGLGAISSQVNALTDPKLTAGRKSSLVGSLTRAQTYLNKPTPKTRQACAQLKAFITRVNVYARLHIITQPEADALIAAATAAKTTNGCP